jgi:hypothetical protein
MELSHNSPISLRTIMNPEPAIYLSTDTDPVPHTGFANPLEVNILHLLIDSLQQVCVYTIIFGFPDPLVKGKGSEDPHPRPDPYQNATDPEHWDLEDLTIPTATMFYIKLTPIYYLLSLPMSKSNEKALPNGCDRRRIA